MRAVRMIVTGFLLIGLGLAWSALGGAQATQIRWDIVSVSAPTGTPTLKEGGVAYGRANDGSAIKLAGSGTFGPGILDAVTGGGKWTTYNADENITGIGTYEVTGLVRYALTTGTLPDAVFDLIGKNADARAGLVVLRIRYSDESEGILIVTCSLEGSPASGGEGISVTKGSTLFGRVLPVPDIDANRTVFHIVP